MKGIKRRTFEIVSRAEEDDLVSKLFDVVILSLIMLNVIGIVMESFETMRMLERPMYRLFSLISILIFSFEYVARVWTSDLLVDGLGPIRSRLKYMLTPMAVIDLLAILPFYLPMLIGVDLRFLRIFRMARVLRLFRTSRYSRAMDMLGRVIEDKKEELMITLSILVMLILVASTLMYNVEHDAQPEAFPNIIASFWWAIITLTTVGYGDVYPITVVGRFLAAIISILGVGIVALPTGILSSGFMKEIDALAAAEKEAREAEEEKNHVHVSEYTYCPHCGEKIK